MLVNKKGKLFGVFSAVFRIAYSEGKNNHKKAGKDARNAHPACVLSLYSVFAPNDLIACMHHK